MLNWILYISIATGYIFLKMHIWRKSHLWVLNRFKSFFLAMKLHIVIASNLKLKCRCFIKMKKIFGPRIHFFYFQCWNLAKFQFSCKKVHILLNCCKCHVSNQNNWNVDFWKYSSFETNIMIIFYLNCLAVAMETEIWILMHIMSHLPTFWHFME